MNEKYTMIGCSSGSSLGMSELNNTSNLRFMNDVFYFGGIKSSKVKSKTEFEDIVVVYTVNTIYTFKKENNE